MLNTLFRLQNEKKISSCGSNEYQNSKYNFPIAKSMVESKFYELIYEKIELEKQK